VLALHRDLAALRRTLEGRARASSPADGILVVERGARVLAMRLYGDAPLPPVEGRVLLWSEDAAYGGDTSADGPCAMIVERA
jgi:hypothetical protein